MRALLRWTKHLLCGSHPADPTALRVRIWLGGPPDANAEMLREVFDLELLTADTEDAIATLHELSRLGTTRTAVVVSLDDVEPIERRWMERNGRRLRREGLFTSFVYPDSV